MLQTKACFERRVLIAQENEMQPPQAVTSRLWEGLGFCGVSIVLFLVAALFALLFPREGPGIAPGAIVGFLAISAGVIGLRDFAGASIKLISQRRVRLVCPNCTTDLLVFYRKVLLCTSCCTPLHFKAIPKPTLVVLVCPYCVSQHAIQTDYGDFRCPDCGLVYSIVEGRAVEKDFNAIACTSCGHAVPPMTYWCKYCGCVITTKYCEGYADSDADQKRLGMGAVGHYRYALAVYELISRELSDVRLHSTSIQSSLRMLRGVQAIVEGIEIATRVIPPAALERLLTDLDKQYAVILWKISEEMKRYGNSYSSRRLTEPLFVLSAEKPSGFVLLRNEVVNTVSANLPPGETQMLRAWQTPLMVAVKRSQATYTSSSVAPPGLYEFTGYDDFLKEEAKRLYPDVVNTGFGPAEAETPTRK